MSKNTNTQTDEKPMRLDRFLSSLGLLSRSECGKAVKSGRITVNGKTVKKADEKLLPGKDNVTLDGKAVLYRRFTYLMLNKPDGVVSATEDGDRTVIDLLPPELQRLGLFPCGRLDKNTVGLVLLMNNGPLAHRLLAPKSHVEKQYAFEAKYPLSEDDRRMLEKGVDIGGYVTAPCRVELSESTKGVITLSEGKYHQIKLMLKAVHNSVVFLERIRFAGIPLDRSLSRGAWRYLTPEEEQCLEKAGFPETTQSLPE